MKISILSMSLMKSRFNLFIYISLGALFMVSCEQDALVDPPAFEKKPAIMCLMSPQSSMIEASLVYTKPYYGLQKDENEYISDALIVITEEATGVVDTMYNYAPGMYAMNIGRITLKEKNWYQMVVRLSDGKSFSARSQVPPKADLNKFKIASVKMGKPYEDLNNGGWGPYIVNPYAVEFLYDLGDADFYVSPQLEAAAKNADGEQIDVRISFVDDILRGETNKSTSFSTQSEFYSGFGIEGPFTINTFSGAVYTMDKAYRDYYRMQMLQDEDNPFSEPVLFPNNFSGGALGVFGTYDFAQGTFEYTP
jgi:hypothetical protein